jgi:hypothetical protein
VTAARPIVNNFTSGELSPRMRARVDLDQYAAGASRIENFLVLPQGGITRRSGSTFVQAAKTPATRVRLVSMVVSTLVAYVLEWGDLYVRFYRNRGAVVAAGVPLELVTPYHAGDLAQLSFAQSADVLFIAHPAYAPRKLSRTAADAFTFQLVPFLDGPYLDENTGDVGAPADGGVSASGTGTTSTDAGAGTGGYISDAGSLSGGEGGGADSGGGSDSGGSDGGSGSGEG